MLMLLVLPLFPAQPLLGPIYVQVDRFMPPDFPLLLVVPALAIDLLMRRVTTRRLARLGPRRGARTRVRRRRSSPCNGRLPISWCRRGRATISSAATAWTTASPADPGALVSAQPRPTTSPSGFPSPSPSASCRPACAVVGQLDVSGAAVIARRWTSLSSTLAVVLCALVSMAHVGSPDTFFPGQAGPYDVRVSVRLPGVIPGRAQVTVRVLAASNPGDYRVGVRAGQWNVGLEGAPPPDIAAPVPGDPTLYAAEIWFMTASSYQMAVDVDGPSGRGTAIVPVLALATTERAMPPWLGGVLVVLGIVLTAGLLTMIGAPCARACFRQASSRTSRRRTRARLATAAAVVGAVVILWGGNVWWEAEAESYRAVRSCYRPFDDGDVAVGSRGRAADDAEHPRRALERKSRLPSVDTTR